MKVALTGASGLVGRSLWSHLKADGHEVVTLGRTGADLPFDLDSAPPSLVGCDALVHAGFAHIPGRYRGGEGGDPEGFVRRNRDGSVRLFERAAQDGVQHLVFLSSRAVYGAYPAGTSLREDMEPRPDTLYGQVKRDVERALGTLPPHSIALRATGVYGPGPGHKWSTLFADFLAGRPVAPRVATEVHLADLYHALTLALPGTGHQIFNVSDLVLDRHDLLSRVAQLTGVAHAPPARADTGTVSEMDCTALRSLGWVPGGWPLLEASLPDMLPVKSQA